MTAARKLSVLWKQELDTIRKRHGGFLRGCDVVEYAKNPKTALHQCFCWDDNKAAHEYRLWQARELISAVYVTVIPGDTREYRAYVSLKEDQQKPGGGYRSLVSVLSVKEQRQKLVAQALAEFDMWREKHESLKELTVIFDARKKIV